MLKQAPFKSSYKKVKLYKDISGNSGVVAYEIGKDYIKIRFKHEDHVYLYSYHNPGKKHVEAMKRLAEAGEKLSTYISVNVRDNYEAKL
jgi:hypothetical protein